MAGADGQGDGVVEVGIGHGRVDPHVPSGEQQGGWGGGGGGHRSQRLSVYLIKIAGTKDYHEHSDKTRSGECHRPGGNGKGRRSGRAREGHRSSHCGLQNCDPEGPGDEEEPVPHLGDRCPEQG